MLGALLGRACRFMLCECGVRLTLGIDGLCIWDGIGGLAFKDDTNRRFYLRFR